MDQKCPYPAVNSVFHGFVKVCLKRTELKKKKKYSTPITVFAPPGEWVCGLSLAGIAGSNPAGGMVVCLL